MAMADRNQPKKRFSFEFWASAIMANVSAVVLGGGLVGGDRGNIAIGVFGLLFFGFGAIVLGSVDRGKRPPVPRRLTQPRRSSTLTNEARRGNIGPSTNPQSLTESDRGALERAIEVLASVGVFAPEVPTATQLESAGADYGPPVGIGLVMSSVYSAPYYDDAFVAERYTENLRFQHSKLEQTSEVIEAQVTDLVALSRGGLDMSGLAIEFAADAGNVVTVRCVLNGEPFEVTYVGSDKWLSTVLIQRLAAVYERLDLPTRFAAISLDDGVYLTSLRRGAVEELNATFPQSNLPWPVAQWADEESFAFEAGAM